MSRDIGEWVRRRLSILQNWRDFVKKVVRIVKEVVPEAEVYVFGSVLESKVTGSSDIDILVVVPDDVDLKKTYLDIVLRLEDAVGEDSYLLDVHIVRKSDVERPPYAWWLRRAVRVG